MKAETTAALVVSMERAGLVSRRRMAPREQHSLLLESAYAKRVVDMVDEWRAEIEPLLRDMPQMVAGLSRRLDDVPEYARVRSTINRVREVAYRQASRVRDSAGRAGREAVDHQGKQLQRQLKAGLGIEVPTTDRTVTTRVAQFVERNVADIQSLGDKTAADVQRLILDAFDQGMRPEELAPLIQERFDVAEAKARLIASGELRKLSAQVRRDRHTEIGIKMFEWRNSPSHIARGVVRDSHAVKHGKVFPYEGSRAPSFFPGEEYGCGCIAFPVLDEIKGRAAELAGKGRRRIV